MQGQSLFGASQEPMELSSGPADDGHGDCSTPHKMDLDTKSCHGQKRGEDFTPRQRVKLQMTAPSPVAGGCPGCAAEVQGHQCQEARTSSGASGQGGGFWSSVQQQTSRTRSSHPVEEWEWAAGLEWELEPLNLSKSSSMRPDDHLAVQKGRGQGVSGAKAGAGGRKLYVPEREAEEADVELDRVANLAMLFVLPDLQRREVSLMISSPALWSWSKSRLDWR